MENKIKDAISLYPYNHNFCMKCLVGDGFLQSYNHKGYMISICDPCNENFHNGKKTWVRDLIVRRFYGKVIRKPENPDSVGTCDVCLSGSGKFPITLERFTITPCFVCEDFPELRDERFLRYVIYLTYRLLTPSDFEIPSSDKNLNRMIKKDIEKELEKIQNKLMDHKKRPTVEKIE